MRKFYIGYEDILLIWTFKMITVWSFLPVSFSIYFFNQSCGDQNSYCCIDSLAVSASFFGYAFSWQIAITVSVAVHNQTAIDSEVSRLELFLEDGVWDRKEFSVKFLRQHFIILSEFCFFNYFDLQAYFITPLYLQRKKSALWKHLNFYLKKKLYVCIKKTASDSDKMTTDLS